MKTTPIKKEFKELPLKDLIEKKSQIALFLFDHPENSRYIQGAATVYALHALIKFKQKKDQFVEAVIKEFYFE